MRVVSPIPVEEEKYENQFFYYFLYPNILPFVFFVFLQRSLSSTV